MKTTILTRILIATLVPVFIALFVVVWTGRSVIYRDGMAYAREIVRLAAEQLSERTAEKLESASALQNDISIRFAQIDPAQQDARQIADGLLTTLLLANRDLYSVWFAFEPGVFTEQGRYFKTYMRGDDDIYEIFDMSDAQLDDPARSPWYNEPLRTGHVYADINDNYDYQTGEGMISLFTMTVPIWGEDGKVAGCVGLDIRYEDLFTFAEPMGGDSQRILLASAFGEILFSARDGNIGESLDDLGVKDSHSALAFALEAGVWQGEIESPETGEELLACLYPLEITHTGQTIFLYRDIPAESLYQSFYSSMEIIIITGTLGIILLAVCVLFSTRGIVRHVKRITDSFNHVANDSADITLSGEHIPVEQTRIVELDTLQAALISMMSQLRKAHELRLRAVEAEVEKEKLIASAEAKTNFFASMSHEIRTPMNAIHGIAEILLFEGGLAPSQEKHVNDIKISSDALLRIINDILDISRLEAGKMELRPEHYHFRALMDNIASLASQLAANAGLQFIFRPEGELPVCLFGDEARLRQVLLNLIGNAIKFTREGYVMLRVILRGDSIRFDVVDTGIGIKDNQEQTVFEAFKRVDTRRNRSVTGTGLGLSISKNIVELMGGFISLKSIYGEGSTFSVTVPLIPGDETKLRLATRKAGIRFSDDLRILIVDDNEINLRVSSGLFKAAYGILCDTAKSGREAIAKVCETDYDIIFMDHMMPEMDGVDTTKSIRKLGGKFESIPIIALTANAVSGTKQELMAEGMNDFLAKPIQSGRLREILENWVPKEKRLPPPSNENTEKPFEKKLLERQNDKYDVPYGIPARGMLEAEGLDVIRGLENVGFDEQAYIRSLRLLMDRLPVVSQTMEELLVGGNIRDFMIQMHGLKGSLASIGATAYAMDALELERAASENDVGKCAELLPSYLESIKILQSVFQKALPAEEFADNAGNNPAISEILQRLCAALEVYDYDAINGELAKLLSHRYGEQKTESISQIKLLIDSFEYPAAITLIRDELAG